MHQSGPQLYSSLPKMASGARVVDVWQWNRPIVVPDSTPGAIGFLFKRRRELKARISLRPPKTQIRTYWRRGRTECQHGSRDAFRNCLAPKLAHSWLYSRQEISSGTGGSNPPLSATESLSPGTLLSNARNSPRMRRHLHI